MSYILDALAKSQRERRVGAVPTLSFAPPAPDAGVESRGGHANAVAIAVVAVAAILIGVDGLLELDAPASVAADGRSPAAAPADARVSAPATEIAVGDPASAASHGRGPRTSASARTGAHAPAAGPSRSEPQGRSRTGRTRRQPAAPRQPPPAAAESAAESVQVASETAATDPPSPVPAPAGVTDARRASLSPAASRLEQDILAVRERLGLDRLDSGEHAAPPAKDGPDGRGQSLPELEAPRVEDVLLDRRQGAPAESAPPGLDPMAIPGPPASGPAYPETGGSLQARAAPDLRPQPVPARPAQTSTMPRSVPRAAPAGGLPAPVAHKVGPLVINAHVYAAKPAERMIIINMNRYREGEQLREGPRLEQITPTGAILSFESARFRLEAR